MQGLLGAGLGAEAATKLRALGLDARRTLRQVALAAMGGTLRSQALDALEVNGPSGAPSGSLSEEEPSLIDARQEADMHRLLSATRQLEDWYPHQEFGASYTARVGAGARRLGRRCQPGDAEGT